MTTTLAGNNPFLLKQRLSELIDKFVKENGQLALERIDGIEVSSDGLMEAVQSLPFLTKRRMVVIDNLSQNKPAAEQAEQIISSVSPTTDVIFFEPEIDRRTAFFKVLKAQTKMEEYNRLDGAALVRWLVNEAKKRGAKLNQADAQYLVQRVGEGQLLLSNELEKLITRQADINRELIDLLVEPTPQSKVFELLDSAFAGQKARTIRLYEEQRAQKVEPQQIMAMIGWQLWLLGLASTSGGRGGQAVAGDAGLGSTFPADKAIRLTRKIGPLGVTDLTEKLYRIDMMAKTKPIDLDEALKNYLVNI